MRAPGGRLAATFLAAMAVTALCSCTASSSSTAARATAPTVTASPYPQPVSLRGTAELTAVERADLLTGSGMTHVSPQRLRVTARYEVPGLPSATFTVVSVDGATGRFTPEQLWRFLVFTLRHVADAPRSEVVYTQVGTQSVRIPVEYDVQTQCCRFYAVTTADQKILLDVGGPSPGKSGDRYGVMYANGTRHAYAALMASAPGGASAWNLTEAATEGLCETLLSVRVDPALLVKLEQHGFKTNGVSMLNRTGLRDLCISTAYAVADKVGADRSYATYYAHVYELPLRDLPAAPWPFIFDQQEYADISG